MGQKSNIIIHNVYLEPSVSRDAEGKSYNFFVASINRSSMLSYEKKKPMFDMSAGVEDNSDEDSSTNSAVHGMGDDRLAALRPSGSSAQHIHLDNYNNNNIITTYYPIKRGGPDSTRTVHNIIYNSIRQCDIGDGDLLYGYHDASRAYVYMYRHVHNIYYIYITM